MKLFCVLVLLLFRAGVRADDEWITFGPGEGPGMEKHVVFVTGEEEYRSEEAAPMLARVLSTHHGFKTTVLFSISKARGKDKDKEKKKDEGNIDPNTPDNIPGLVRLDGADMMVMMLRFRELPDDDMKHIADFVRAGKPILAVRTSTHAFAYTMRRDGPYASWDWQSSVWPGGFGQQIVGDTWVRHQGGHGKESTRGVITPEHAAHPVLRGVRDIWGPTDVYGVDKLPPGARILVRGQVLAGMAPTDPPVPGAKNDPMQPLVWIRDYQLEGGQPGKVIASTIGAAVDLECADLRRLFVNAIYWGCGLESQIAAEANVDPVGEYKPSNFGFNGFKKGVKPADLQK
jgi:Trehalose utilisation